MIHTKTKSMYPSGSGNNLLVDSMLLRLRQGLTSVLAALGEHDDVPFGHVPPAAHERLPGTAGLNGRVPTG